MARFHAIGVASLILRDWTLCAGTGVMGWDAPITYLRGAWGYTDVDLERVGDHLTEHQRRVVQQAHEQSLYYR